MVSPKAVGELFAGSSRSAKFFVIRSGRVVNHIVPPDGLGQNFTLRR
jgi:hypothetical protein